jgi:hypothetical protein
VTALDAEGAISHGEVLAYSPSRADISDAVIQSHRENPGSRTYVLRGGPVAFSLDELPRLVEEAEALYLYRV